MDSISKSIKNFDRLKIFNERFTVRSPAQLALDELRKV